MGSVWSLQCLSFILRPAGACLLSACLSCFLGDVRLVLCGGDCGIGGRQKGRVFLI